LGCSGVRDTGVDLDHPDGIEELGGIEGGASSSVRVDAGSADRPPRVNRTIS
jgi:hypothetical protein